MNDNHRQQNKVTHDEFKKRFMPLWQMLYREAYRMLCDRFEAEDAVQNLYVRLWEKRGELKNLIAPDAYCRTLLKNICIDRWRQIRAHDDDEQIGTDEITSYTPPETDSKEAEECLQHFLAGLSGVQQKVIRMKINGCSFEEIEKVTGLQQTNIRVIISRIRKRFRKFYDNL